MAVKQNNDENNKQINSSNVSQPQVSKDQITQQNSDDNINLLSFSSAPESPSPVTISATPTTSKNCTMDSDTIKKDLKPLSFLICPKHPEELKKFKENLQSILKIYEKICEENREYYIIYLRQVFTLISTTEASCSIAIIFQLFPNNEIVHALQRAFQTFDDTHDDKSIKKTVKTLCEWIRICTFCTNLHIWILSIINALYNKKKIPLLLEICEENIEQLFISLIIPHCREKVFFIVNEILSFIKNDPTIFHKIVRRVPSIIRQLRKECEENKNKSEEIVKTKRVLSSLIDLMFNLIKCFPVRNDFYSELKTILTECSTSNFRLFLNTIYDEQIVQNKKVGLLNLGNTCYMNSVLQVLGLTKEFVYYILLSDCKTPLFSSLRILLVQMYYSNRIVLAPTDLLTTARPSYFTIGVQQDSSELLLYLLETLHEQENQYFKKNIELCNVNKLNESHWIQGLPDIINTNQNMSINDSESVDIKYSVPSSDHEEFVEKEECINKSIVDKAFTGKLIVKLKCLVCNTVSTTNDNLRCFQLSHPENEIKYSAQELLDYFCSTEKLEGDNQYYCEQCQCYNNAEISKTVNSAPKNAILVFKQFTYDKKTHAKGKLLHKIYPNENITIHVQKDETGFSVEYSLYAGIIHSGSSVDSGHYHAFGTDLTRNSDNSLNWYSYNDQNVTKFNFDEINNLYKTDTPYILFYRQVDNDIENLPNFSALPLNLQQFIDFDNNRFYDELRRADLQRVTNFYNDHNLRKYTDNDDTDEPPPSGGCGENALNININNFIC